MGKFYLENDEDLTPGLSEMPKPKQGGCGSGSCGCGSARSRREFLQTGLMVVGALALGRVVGTSTQAAESHEAAMRATHALTGDAARVGVPGRKWIMAIDLAKCDGCGKCTEACSKMHFIPPTREWIKVLRIKDSEKTAPYYFPMPCFQCDNPPCTKVCPVDATFKRQDGVVIIDNDRCIGCRLCMAACPYNARSFNWELTEEAAEAKTQPYSPERGFPRKVGTVEKCDFCPDMAAAGKLPACASICPMGAIYYGDENEDAVTSGLGETVRLSKLLKDRAGYRHMEELGTKPRVYYLPPKDRMYPAPNESTVHG